MRLLNLVPTPFDHVQVLLRYFMFSHLDRRPEGGGRGKKGVKERSREEKRGG